jgi:hypothetical protein
MKDEVKEYLTLSWEERAAMWHDKYVALLAIEREHTHFKEALERIAKGVSDKARCVAIAQLALSKFEGKFGKEKNG